MFGFNDLVAGEGTAGLVDGPFYSAQFHSPEGLAINPEGTRLYVADRDNNCIRVIDLDHGNQVSTLTGQIQSGNADGPFETALFHSPLTLAYLPGDRLAVNDYDNARIRLLDLKTRSVSTLAGTGVSGIKDGEGSQALLGPVHNMVYLTTDDALYFTQPRDGALRKIDLKTKTVITVLSHHPFLPNPTALCVGNDKLYVADQYASQVYVATPLDKAKPGDNYLVGLRAVASGEKIKALGFSGNCLYALQVDENQPFQRLLPERPITFVSVWGDAITRPTRDVFFSDLLNPLPQSLVADPRSERRFFIAHPSLNNISALRELSQADLNRADALNKQAMADFEYPLIKPAKTYRILLIGDSHTFNMYESDMKKRGWEGYNRMVSLSKRLELDLNTLAALEDEPTHFEVLHDGRNSGEPLNVWPYYVVPGLVQKYDVDLVLYVVEPLYFINYFVSYYQWPLTKEGIPAQKMDPEFLLQPLTSRIPKGAPRRFFDLCSAKKILTIRKDKEIQFDEYPTSFLRDDAIRGCMVEMYGKPIEMLREKLEKMETSEGNSVRVEMCLMSFGRLSPSAEQKPFWNEVRERTGIPILDLLDPMTALRMTYFPFSEEDGFDHFSADGQSFMAFLFAHELIHQKVIPWEPLKKGKVHSEQ